jgi:hypothetical protein
MKVKLVMKLHGCFFRVADNGSRAWRRWACRMLNFSRMFLPTFAKPVLYEVPTYYAEILIETINKKQKEKKRWEKTYLGTI